MKRCSLFRRKHKMFFIRRDRLFGLYHFECKNCGQRISIHRYPFWNGHPRNPVAELLWNNT